MTHIPICVNPVLKEDMEKLNKELPFAPFVDLVKFEYMNELKPYCLDFETINTCAGSCLACYSGSTPECKTMLPKEKVFEVIDDAVKLGVRQMAFGGGDPLLHPDWMEMLSYANDSGFRPYLASSGLISKKQAKEIVSLGKMVDCLPFHMDTINEEAYKKLYWDPKTRELRLQGLKNILEAGFPLERMAWCLTLTKYSAQTIEETMDFIVDEIGIENVMFIVYKPIGFPERAPYEGAEQLFKDLEPSISEVKRALEYRVKKLGEHWIKIGTCDADKFTCRTIVGVKCTGDVMPCVTMFMPVGNIHKESFYDIFQREKETLLYNFQVEGPCGTCEHNDICWGCRATAYGYTGNVKASDPKCFMNTEAKEYYLH